jgi:hypothetical protein
MEITELWTHYCTLLDTQQSARVADDIFTEDGEFRALGLHGRDAIRSGLVNVMSAFEMTAHVLSNAVIRLEGDTAWGQAYITAIHWLRSASSTGRLRPADWTAVVVQTDQLRREPEGWRVAVGELVPVGGPVAAGTWPDSIPLPKWT